MKTIVTLVAAAASLCSAAAFAGTWDPAVDHRQLHQHARIAEGVASGELTIRETARLRAEQRAIALEERIYKRDGHLSAFERRDLHRELNAASRHIHRQKHDAQRR